MIKLNPNSKIQEIKKTTDTQQPNHVESVKNKDLSPTTQRPEVVDAKVYQVKSAFVKNSVFVTLSYIKQNS